MADVYELEKRADELLDVRIEFENADGETTYTVATVELSAIDMTTGESAPDVIDPARTTYSGNRATVWVKAGTAKRNYQVDALVTMTTGQKIGKRLLMKVYE